MAASPAVTSNTVQSLVRLLLYFTDIMYSQAKNMYNIFSLRSFLEIKENILFVDRIHRDFKVWQLSETSSWDIVTNGHMSLTADSKANHVKLIVSISLRNW